MTGASYTVPIVGFVPDVDRIDDAVMVSAHVEDGKIFCNSASGWILQRVNEDGSVDELVRGPGSTNDGVSFEEDVPRGSHLRVVPQVPQPVPAP